MPISAVQQSDEVIHIHTFFSYILFHYVLSQEIGYSSLCYTVGPCCLSILNVIVCIYQPQTPSPSLSLPPPPWQPQVCSLCLWVCFFFVDGGPPTLDLWYSWYLIKFLILHPCLTSDHLDLPSTIICLNWFSKNATTLDVSSTCSPSPALAIHSHLSLLYPELSLVLYWGIFPHGNSSWIKSVLTALTTCSGFLQ